MTPITLSHRATQITGSRLTMDTSVLPAIAAWKSANPSEPFVPFVLGDTTYGPEEYVRTAAIASLRTDPHKYSIVRGETGLLRAIARDISYCGIKNIDPLKQICVTNGTLEGLSLGMQALVNPGDEVILPAPYYFLYPRQVVMAGGTVVVAPTTETDGYKLTSALLKEKITDKTKLLVINTPLNPVGAIYSKQELQALAKVLEQHPNIYIFCDEIYRPFALDVPHTSLWEVAPKLRDRTVVFQHFSKPSGWSGLRVGWIIGHEQIIDAVVEMKKGMSWNTSTLGQAAAQKGLSDTREYEAALTLLRKKLLPARNHMTHRLEDLGFKVPHAYGGMFLFPQIPESLVIPRMGVPGEATMSKGERFALWLVNYGTSVAPSIDMDPSRPDRFRIVFATDMETIDMGMERIAQAVSSA